MPTYEYICTDCGYEFEEFQRITADPLTTCPKCGGVVKRKISAGAGLVFKGSGFYITDYKDKKSSSSTVTQSENKTQKNDSKKTK